jgi:hypothetical protein
LPARIDPGAAALTELSAFDGGQVAVFGTLRGLRLHVDTVEPIAVDAHADTTPSPRARSGQSFRERIAAERTLMAGGILLDAWTDARTGRRIALTTDVALTRATLAPYYEGSLHVVRSRWDHRYLDGIRAQVDDDLLLSFGNSIGTGQQLRLAMTLLHLPSRLARLLSAYPAEALDVRLLIRPPGPAPLAAA